MTTLVLAVCLLGQDPSSYKPTSEHLKHLEWLIGTWVGEVDAGPMGKATAEYKYEWALNKNFLRLDFRMSDAKGKEIFFDTGYLGWDRDKKKLVAFHFGMDGTIGWGEQIEGGDGKDTVTFEGNTTGPYKNFRAQMTREGDDKIVYQMFIKKGDEWKPEGGKQVFTRKKAKKDE